MDPASQARKVKGTIHWVCADTAQKAEVRLYENIVDEEKGVYNEDGSINLNPNSLTVMDELLSLSLHLQRQSRQKVSSLSVMGISVWILRIPPRITWYLTGSYP